MRIRSITAAVALTVAAVIGGSAAAPAEPQDAQHLRTELRPVEHALQLRTDRGALRVTDHQLQIVDPRGTVVGGVPLTITYQNTAYPIDAAIDGNTATLTPRPERAQHVSAPADSFEDRLNTAMGNANNELTVALAAGTLLGAIIGLPVGCLLGALFGGGAGAVTTFGALSVPLAIGGCIATGTAGAALGVLVFNLIIGVPAVIAAAIHFYNTMTAPPATEK
ncbi:hypothetical protein [Nocardia sp. NPDC052566]|uniref:hypothetical protein n=1 Tax=Nocardia sp. NPDC052566 TaxID=3364330 RepID=UPI0037C6FE26